VPRRPLARAWLERLDAVLAVDGHDVFPSHQLLDHIPDVLRQIAVYLRAPVDEEIAANTAVMAKAGELGERRFDQRALVHQLVREYQLLGAVLEEFSPGKWPDAAPYRQSDPGEVRCVSPTTGAASRRIGSR
jgi:hypothetical protein